MLSPQKSLEKRNGYDIDKVRTLILQCSGSFRNYDCRIKKFDNFSKIVDTLK